MRGPQPSEAISAPRGQLRSQRLSPSGISTVNFKVKSVSALNVTPNFNSTLNFKVNFLNKSASVG